MKYQKFVLPGLSIGKLESIIGAYYRANRTISSMELSRDFNNTISVQEVSGSVTFLQNLGILSSEKGNSHHLTDFGKLFGMSIINHSSVQISRCWGKAIKNSRFLNEVFNSIVIKELIDQNELLLDIVVKAGREPKSNSLQGARTIIKIMEKGGLISRKERLRKIFIQVKEADFTSHYIGRDRIDSLSVIKNSKYDLSKLLEICNEINYCYDKEFYYAVGILTRVVIDHIPPIFGYRTFKEVVNNYSGSRSFREHMQVLDGSTRKIADTYAHSLIQRKESQPSPTQVNFSADLDVLLSEIIKVLNVSEY